MEKEVEWGVPAARKIGGQWWKWTDRVGLRGVAQRAHSRTRRTLLAQATTLLFHQNPRDTLPQLSMLLVLLIFFHFFCLTSTVLSENLHWSFVQITDIHIGDSHGKSLLYLQSIVHLVNQLNQKADYNLRYAFLTGDLTNSALPQEWNSIPSIMSRLDIPFFPLIGNHDMQAYNSSWQEEHPTGDATFQRLFGSQLQQHPHVHLYTGNHRVNNPEHNIQSYFHNYILDSEDPNDPLFVALDWNSRAKAAPTYKGTWPGAELHDFKNGTFQWFQNEAMPWIRNRLCVETPITGETSCSNRSVILLQHHPFRAPMFVPTGIFGWRSKDKTRVRTEILERQPFAIPLHVAGHFHRWWDGTAFDTFEKSPDLMQHETPASKDNGYFAVFRVQNGKVVRIEEFHAGPVYNNKRGVPKPIRVTSLKHKL